MKTERRWCGHSILSVLLALSGLMLSAQEWMEQAGQLSLPDVHALERNLHKNSEDLASRELLITYYTLHADKAKRLEHALWLAEHHPEAVSNSPYFQIAENDSPFDSLTSYEKARTIWLRHAESRTTDPRVLRSAAWFIAQFDPNDAERLMLQGRELEPSDRQWDWDLADLYGKGIFTDGRFRPQTPPSPARHLFALRARLVLERSRNPVMVGLAGLRLAPQDITILRTRSVEDQQFGEQLLHRAHELAPQDPQWEIYLRDFAAAQKEMASPEQPELALSEAVPGKLVQRLAPAYPEAARKAGIKGVVQLRILIGVTGRVIVVRPIEGPFELQAAAAAAVKQWRYKPFLLNGMPVESWKEVAVSFP